MQVDDIQARIDAIKDSWDFMTQEEQKALSKELRELSDRLFAEAYKLKEWEPKGGLN